MTITMLTVHNNISKHILQMLYNKRSEKIKFRAAQWEDNPMLDCEDLNNSQVHLS